MNTTDEEMYSIALEDILSFATGASSIPPMGFIPNPQLNFHHESPYPMANTCANIISLPIFGHTYDSFVNAFCFGITNAIGFGQI